LLHKNWAGKLSLSSVRNPGWKAHRKTRLKQCRFHSSFETHISKLPLPTACPRVVTGSSTRLFSSGEVLSASPYKKTILTITTPRNPRVPSEYVVKTLVDNPNDVKVVRTVDEMGVLLSLGVHPEDMGKVIGRQGNTAKAIRILLRVVGMKNNARVNLKINEPEGSERPEKSTSVDDAIDDLKI
jgi:predicted RNA-binding protein YlqC (UPF0109 family)